MIAGVVVVLGRGAVVVGNGIGSRNASDAHLKRLDRSPGRADRERRDPGDRRQQVLPRPAGRLEAYARAPIYARVSGFLKAWYVDIGAPVKAGELLAEIEAPDLDQQLLQAKAALASAQASEALAKVTAQRWQPLGGTNAVSQADGRREDRRSHASRRR